MHAIRRITLASFALLFLAVVTLQAHAANDQHRVRAALDGDALASGKADYRERMRGDVVEQRFSIEVQDAEPGAMMMVHVNGLLVGIIVIDDFGIGELQYRTADFIDEPGDGDPIPDGFPTLLDGDTVTVGPLAGVFELR